MIKDDVPFNDDVLQVDAQRIACNLCLSGWIIWWTPVYLRRCIYIEAWMQTNTTKNANKTTK